MFPEKKPQKSHELMLAAKKKDSKTASSWKRTRMLKKLFIFGWQLLWYCHCFHFSCWGMLTCCLLFLAASKLFSGNKSFSVASKKSKQLSSLMLLFLFVPISVVQGRVFTSTGKQRENCCFRYSLYLFSSLAFFFWREKKKDISQKRRKNVIPLKRAYELSIHVPLLIQQTHKEKKPFL
jgi:hypothetical protein